jgi:hypothetical protein
MSAVSRACAPVRLLTHTAVSLLVLFSSYGASFMKPSLPPELSIGIRFASSETCVYLVKPFLPGHGCKLPRWSADPFPAAGSMALTHHILNKVYTRAKLGMHRSPSGKHSAQEVLGMRGSTLGISPSHSFFLH